MDGKFVMIPLQIYEFCNVFVFLLNKVTFQQYDKFNFKNCATISVASNFLILRGVNIN